MATQKMQVELKLKEVERALKEIEKLDEGNDVYKSIGSILVKTDKEKLKEELMDKKETLEIRLKTLQRQEEKLVSKLKEMEAKIRQALQSSSDISGISG